MIYRQYAEAELALELRGEQQQPVFTGYASVYNSNSLDMGGYVERIMPGAFDAALAKPDDILALVDHDIKHPLASRSTGTLTLQSDSHGLKVEIAPDVSTSWGRDAVAAVKSNLKRGMSFGFQFAPNGYRWSRDNNGTITREVTGIDPLSEVSIVTKGAYPDAGIACRSAEDIEVDNVRSLLIAVREGLQLTNAEVDKVKDTISLLQRSIQPDNRADLLRRQMLI
jgi:uncharacterized protein